MRSRSRSIDPRLINLPDEKISAEEATVMAGVGLFHIKLIIISAFVWMARGFDLVVMRFVIPLLSCEWKLKLWQGALLNMITLFSTILGCILYGIWSDKYGRKMAFYSLLFLFIFGSISAVAPTFTYFIIFRVVAAFSVGGLYQTLVLCCELFPGGKRGQVVYTLSTFWALSVIIMQYVLFSTMIRGYSWKLFVVIGTLPALLATCLVKFYPESFRYQMVKEKYAAANDTMAKMLKGSGKKMTAQLLQLPQSMTRELVLDLFRKPFQRYFTWLLILGLLTSICYRGVVDMWLQTLLTWRHINLTDDNKFSSILFMIDMDRSIKCFKHMDLEEFKFITWTTALDYPAFVIYLILSDWISRKILLTASYVLSLIFCCLLVPFPLLSLININFASEEILFMIFSYFSRTILLGQYDLILLIVAEGHTKEFGYSTVQEQYWKCILRCDISNKSQRYGRRIRSSHFLFRPVPGLLSKSRFCVSGTHLLRPVLRDDAALCNWLLERTGGDQRKRTEGYCRGTFG